MILDEAQAIKNPEACWYLRSLKNVVHFDRWWNPALFFELRGIEIGKFVDVALANRVERMLENAQKPSRRILDDEESAQRLFGVL